MKEKWFCPLCGFEIKANRAAHLEYCNGLGPKKFRFSKNGSEESRKKRSDAIKKKYLEDLSYREKISIATKESWLCGSHNLSNEKLELKKEKNRQDMLDRYAKGWEATAGRCKKIDYESPIAGKIKIDGTWELRVVKHLDSIGVVWRRNKKRFDYVNLSEKKSTYCPDFYIEDWNTYLEVKGYETDLDRCKWSQFKEPLIVWKKKES